MDEEWNKKAKGLLRSEMTRRSVSYRELAERLRALGVEESEANLRNKVSRGVFAASFLLACFAALGCTTVHLD